MDRVWAVTMMKDEGDVAYHVLRHMASEGVDGIIVADNNSSDATRAELERAQADLTCPVIIHDDPETGYYQSRKMTAMAQEARTEHGATWIIPFDADELWIGPQRVADVLRQLGPHIGTARAALYNHYRTKLDRNDPVAFTAMVWRSRDAGTLPKVAFRVQPDTVVHQGNHGVDNPGGTGTSNLLEVRHFPYRSFEHFKRKAINGARAYASTDLPADQGAHWRGYGEILERHGEDALREVYETYFSFLSPMDADMVRDPAPFCRYL